MKNLNISPDNLSAHFFYWHIYTDSEGISRQIKRVMNSFMAKEISGISGLENKEIGSGINKHNNISLYINYKMMANF